MVSTVVGNLHWFTQRMNIPFDLNKTLQSTEFNCNLGYGIMWIQSTNSSWIEWCRRSECYWKISIEFAAVQSLYIAMMAARCDDEWMRWTNVLHDSEELHRIIALTGECCRRWWRRWQRVRWKNREIILNECMLRHESDISSQCARYFECFARFQHNTHIAFFRYHINNFITRCFFFSSCSFANGIACYAFYSPYLFASFPNDTHSH